MKNVLIRLSFIIFTVFNVFLTKHTVYCGVINKKSITTIYDNDENSLTIPHDPTMKKSIIKRGNYRFEFYTQGEIVGTGIEAFGGLLGQAHAAWVNSLSPDIGSFMFPYTIDNSQWTVAISFLNVNRNVELMNDIFISASTAMYDHYIKGKLQSQKSDQTYYAYAAKVYDGDAFKASLTIHNGGLASFKTNK